MHGIFIELNPKRGHEENSQIQNRLFYSVFWSHIPFFTFCIRDLTRSGTVASSNSIQGKRESYGLLGIWTVWRTSIFQLLKSATF